MTNSKSFVYHPVREVHVSLILIVLLCVGLIGTFVMGLSIRREKKRTEEAVLELLLQHQEAHEEQLVQLAEGDLEEGSVSLALEELEAKGFVISRKEHRYPNIVKPRKPHSRTLYSLSSSGRKRARQHAASL